MPGSIAELQTIQHKVAEIELLLLQARTLLYATSEERFEIPAKRADLGWKLAAAKTTVTRHVVRASELASRLTGSAGWRPTRRCSDFSGTLGPPPDTHRWTTPP
jgi:alkylation response protein AidB-like acyl-CoA dehydrogenase